MHCGLADLVQRERYKHTISPTMSAFVLWPQNILRLYSVTITTHNSCRIVRIFM